MRVIIAGGRDFHDVERIKAVMWKHYGARPGEGRTFLSGHAPGADTAGEEWCKGWGIKPTLYPAKWKRPDGTTDRGAGHKRNAEMARNADVLFAFWDGESPGTRSMIQLALDNGLEVHVYRYSNAEERF